MVIVPVVILLPSLKAEVATPLTVYPAAVDTVTPPVVLVVLPIWSEVAVVIPTLSTPAVSASKPAA